MPISVTYKECVVIDDHEYTILSYDCSDSIAEQIRDEVIEGDAQSIIDSIADDVTNNLDPKITDVNKEYGVHIESSEQLLQAIADALWVDGADTEWSADTTTAIADAIKTERPDLFITRT